MKFLCGFHLRGFHLILWYIDLDQVGWISTKFQWGDEDEARQNIVQKFRIHGGLFTRDLISIGYWIKQWFIVNFFPLVHCVDRPVDLTAVCFFRIWQLIVILAQFLCSSSFCWTWKIQRYIRDIFIWRILMNWVVLFLLHCDLLNSFDVNNFEWNSVVWFSSTLLKIF